MRKSNLKILYFNATYKIGSTGKIVVSLSDIMAKEGFVMSIFK